ncbi:hypothetical protein FB451DRAFT_1162382 [Mycena latifolia]|nr:hypothetical protein FB451DRAFT_1162382 [Mycena latifolia]
MAQELRCAVLEVAGSLNGSVIPIARVEQKAGAGARAMPTGRYRSPLIRPFTPADFVGKTGLGLRDSGWRRGERRRDRVEEGKSTCEVEVSREVRGYARTASHSSSAQRAERMVTKAALRGCGTATSECTRRWGSQSSSPAPDPPEWAVLNTTLNTTEPYAVSEGQDEQAGALVQYHPQDGWEVRAAATRDAEGECAVASEARARREALAVKVPRRRKRDKGDDSDIICRAQERPRGRIWGNGPGPSVRAVRRARPENVRKLEEQSLLAVGSTFSSSCSAREEEVQE